MKITSGVILSMLVTLLMLVSICEAQSAQTAVLTPTSPATGTIATGARSADSATASGALAPNDPDYRIGPLDILRIDVWKEADLSRLAPVRPDGKISLPLLNDVQAAGLTALQLSSAITSGLKDYITNPQVTVSLSEINSRRVYVTGEISHAGALPLLPNMTVLQALSSAGNFTPFAKPKKIYVLRVEAGHKVKHPFNYKEVLAGKKQEQDIALQSGDVIVVP
jgi:polysaccharide export outer membrane protein